MPEESRSDIPKRVFDYFAPSVVAIAFFLLFLALSYISQKVKITWQLLLAGVSVIGLSSLIGVACALYTTRRLFQTDDGSRLEVPPIYAKELAHVLKDALARISDAVTVTDAQVYEVEHQVQCAEIWVVTNDLYKDTPTDSDDITFAPVVEDNIKHRNIKYTYLLPKVTAIERKARQELLAPYNASELKRIRVFFLDADKWAALPYCDGDFAIYNPTRRPATTLPFVYFELPNTNQRYWIAGDSNLAERWAARIEEVVPDITNWST